MTAMLERTSSMTSAEALRATGALLREHGLVGWRVGFGHAKRTAGTCDHRMKVITLSKYLLAQRSYEDSMMTITHEVAGRGSTAPSEATASVASSTPTACELWKPSLRAPISYVNRRHRPGHITAPGNPHRTAGDGDTWRLRKGGRAA